MGDSGRDVGILFGLGGPAVGPDSTATLMAFVVVASVAGLAGLLLTGRGGKLDDRIDDLAGKAKAGEKGESVAKIARDALPKVGRIIVPEDEAERTKLQARLVHAGLYQKQAMYAFLGVKLTLLGLATVVGIGLTTTHVLPPGQALPIAMALFLAGMIGPSFWLDKRKKARQASLRRGLPDALDVMIICIEGGLSFQAGLKKIADELSGAHPILGRELKIVDREIQLGRGPGEALQNFARRTDLEEAQSLASVVGQSERFGASLVKSLRSHSETLRFRRKQKAEEKAQQAATKILFPTLLFIFPAIFVILLAPAAFKVMEALSK